MSSRARSRVRNWVEFAPAWLLLKSLGILPRSAALLVGRRIGETIYYVMKRLRRVGFRNLALAMPDLPTEQRKTIIKNVFRNLGASLAEFSQFPKLNREVIRNLVEYDGFENYKTAAEQGRGVLFLTGHFGAWELCAFAHGALGHPLNFLVRPLDNPLLDGLIDRYRKLSGNTTIDKNDAVRPVLTALKRGEAVGLLIDVNTLTDQGVFCDFFGIPACTTTGLAVFALRSDAPVVPGFLIWEADRKKYRLRFDPEIELIRTGDFKQEVFINTQRFTNAIEQYVRRYPDQWLWIHKRWHTRPNGEPDPYADNSLVPRHDSSINMEAPV